MKSLLVFLMLFLTTACDNHLNSISIKIHGIEFSPTEITEILKLSPLPPPPPNTHNAYADNNHAALFGQFLFFETRLSSNNKVSCATCHQPETHWTDGLKVSVGLEQVSKNSPTLWNTAYNRWQFWDGRKDSLWAQSLAPLENTLEMGGNRLKVFRLVSDDRALREAYEKIFDAIPKLDTGLTLMDACPVPNNPKDLLQLAWSSLSDDDHIRISRLFSNLGKAIEAFERKIISKSAPFDRFVEGIRRKNRNDMESLSSEALRGMKLFIGKGQCILCHTGPNFTDREFHNIGLDRGNFPLAVGRFKGIEQVKTDEFNRLGNYSDDRSVLSNKALHYVTQKPNNLGEFKTPTLRNIRKTGPYMHDGRFENLHQVFDFYSKLNQKPALGHREESLRPLNFTDKEITDLIAFFDSLTGAPLDDSLMQKPDSPGR
ncbi:MAG TPA: hypothetical protein EYQ50_03650 [Verrucomicrobiales bacterium]|nr:hypothetical protein [Verrucomicrobiales bacterium]HIL70629.1 hypothetical protein [Verrucomicrobiota bacterium]